MTGSFSIPKLQTNAGDENGGRTNQTTILEFTDEGATAVASRHKQLFDPTMKKVGSPWDTFGPLGGPTQLMEYTQRVREWHQATVNIPRSGWSAPQVPAGVRPGLFINNITFKKKFKIKNLKLGYFYRLEKNAPYVFVIQTGGKTKTFNGPSQTQEMLVETGDWFGWFGLFPEVPSNSALFINRGDPIRVRIVKSGTRILLSADMKDKPVKKGDTFNFELFHLMFPLDIQINRLKDLTRYVDYLKKPDGLKIINGKRLKEPGHVEIAPNNYMVELKIPRPKAELGLVLPVRIKGLNPRWSAGLWLKKGYVKGIYGTGENRYRALGMDFFGNAYVPIYVDRGEVQETYLVAAHPVIADRKGKDLFIQVTRLAENPFKWHLSVNNPKNNPVTTTLSKLINLPGMKFKKKTLTLPAGGYVVLEGEEENKKSP